MATHIAKVKDLAYRLKMLDEPVSDSIIMIKILMTLPSSYQHFNTAWESTSQDQKTLSNLTARLTMEELRNKQMEDQENSAFAAKTKRRQTQGERKSEKPVKKCFKCGKVGQWKRDCRSKASNANDTKNEKSSVKTED
ncbi:uncharacterized protein [Anoplolepis gracilipes]|uniref:uncharacterized protein n=1 Tax=Anoplolepis gracilipes TaxID=354296 RepID=UPI003BA1ABD5